jgi:NADPH:quinone reductase-like Zn-dependent oxidoreductase
MAEQRTQLQVQSKITSAAKLELFLARVAVPPPKSNEVLVQIEATPINPSDLGLLLGPADMKTAVVKQVDGLPHLSAEVPAAALGGLAARLDQALPVGNEGAGMVIETGDAPEARALMGKRVALLGGEMYSQYRAVPAEQCLELPSGASAAEGASSFVNPMTALGMVETMRMEGHHALVHTAAASNLGQMLHRVCQKDNIALVNIVRSPEQVALLKGLGARYVIDSQAAGFTELLTAALEETGATLAFDATGGGQLASQILNCMEAALAKKATSYSRYGTSTHKQVYLYGSLDTRATEIRRSFGMAWGVGGWLVFPFIQKLGREGAARIRARVVAELTTTFASSYAGELSLRQLFEPANIALYAQRSTGKKYLIVPNKD